MRTRVKSANPYAGHVLAMVLEQPYPPDLTYPRYWRWNQPGWWDEPQIGRYELFEDDPSPKPAYWELWPDKPCTHTLAKGKESHGVLSWNPDEDGQWYGVSGNDTMEVRYSIPAFVPNENLGQYAALDLDFNKLAARAVKAGRNAARIRDANMLVWLGEAVSACKALTAVAKNALSRIPYMLRHSPDFPAKHLRLQRYLQDTWQRKQGPIKRDYGYPFRKFVREIKRMSDSELKELQRAVINAANLYNAAVLAYDWGIKPAIDDLKEAVTNGSKARKRAKDLVRKSGRSKRTVSDFKTLAEPEGALPEEPWLHHGIYAAGTMGRSLGVYAKTSIIVNTHTSLPEGIEVTEDMEAYEKYVARLIRARSLGLTNVPKAIWNLTPFSFMVDWLLGCSDLLDVAFDHSALVTGLVSATTHRHVSRVHEARFYFRGMNQVVKSKNIDGGSFTFYKRWPGIPSFPDDPQPNTADDLLGSNTWIRDMEAFFWLNRAELSQAISTLSQRAASLASIAEYASATHMLTALRDISPVVFPKGSPITITPRDLQTLEPPSMVR